MTIFDALREDHEEQRTVLDRLVETSGDTDERRDLLERISDIMRRHAAAEERYFYVPLMEQDLTQHLARHSVHEHEQLDDLLERLHATELSSSAWLTYARELDEKVRHHLDEEESEVFPVAGRALDEDEKEQLGTDYSAEMERLIEDRPPAAR